MNRPRPWTTLERRTLVDDRWVRLEALRVVTGQGVELDPFYLLREPDWVCGLPLLADGRLLLVAQYRLAADRVTLEFPAGDIEPGEDPATALRRELTEETGYRICGEPAALPALQGDPKRNTATGHAFVVPVEPGGTQDLDPGEDIAIELLTPSQVDAAIADGRFRHAAHVAWLLMARARSAPGTPGPLDASS